MITFTLIMMAMTIPLGKSFIAYDCGVRSLNMTTVSLLDIGQCDVPHVEIKEEKVQVQLL